MDIIKYHLGSQTADRLEDMTAIGRGTVTDEEAQTSMDVRNEGGDTDATSDATATEATVPEPEALASKSSGPPPDGGLWAWLQVAASFSIFFNTWGVLNTFGIFQTYYETGALFAASSSSIAWIGAIQAYCTVSLGLVAGPAYDGGHLGLLLGVGAFLVVLGFMMLSVCTTVWQAVLAQGFCVGIGGGLLFVPSLALLPTYFSTRLGLAVGLAASGSSLGGVVYPILFYRLIGRVGFAWTVRIIAFVVLATLLVPLAVARQRVRPSQTRAFLDLTVLRDPPFLVFTLATLIGFNGLYVMLFYISYYADASGSSSSEMAFYIVPILNSASMFGRIIPNYISDKTGPINCKSVRCCCAAAAAAAIQYWPPANRPSVRSGCHHLLRAHLLHARCQGPRRPCRRCHPLRLLLRRLHRPARCLFRQPDRRQVQAGHPHRHGLCHRRLRRADRRTGR